jgi:hypothetical protein
MLVALANGIEIVLDNTEAMLKAIQNLTRQRVMVGIPSDSAGRPGGPINNASLGYLHEFGSPARNLPARPWLYPEVARQQDKAVELLRRAAVFVTEGKAADGQKQLEALGMMVTAAVKNNILAGGDPPFHDWSDSYKRQRGVAGQKTRSAQTPNAPKSGNYTILVDTAQMLNSITYVIRNKS